MTPHHTLETLELAYINYVHGGMVGGGWLGNPGPYQMDGLIELFSADDRWPDLVVLGEAERWEFDGQNGKFLAQTALNEASGRGYAIELGTLPREWGPNAPALIYDTNKINVHRFFSGREPDFYSRNRNLAIVSPRGQAHLAMNIVAIHGDIHSMLYQLLDWEALRRYASPERPSIILGDFSSSLSGPHFERSNYEVYEEFWQFARTVIWDPNQPHQLPYKANCTPMNYLCGVWQDDENGGHRTGGVGFVHAAERDKVYTPTMYPSANGRDPVQCDGAVLNTLAAKMLMPGSVQIHEPRDPDNPPSDHKRFSCTLYLRAAA